MRKYFAGPALVALSSVLLLGLGAADAQPPAKAKSDCFLSRDWNGWKATPDSKSIYIRVGVRDVYRLDLGYSCPALRGPGAHLVTRHRVSSWLCRPTDWDLRVDDGAGFATPCSVSDMTRLSVEEAAALPPSLKP